MVSILPLQPEDVQEAIRVIHQASIANMEDYPKEFIELLNQEHYSVEWLQKKLENDIWFCKACDDDGTILGTVSHSSNQVTNVFVDYVTQGRGVGRLLMNKVEERLRELGYDEAILTANLTSVGFYRHLGYEVLEENRKEVAGFDITDFSMRKQL